MLPQRMCAVCRARREKSELLRIVKSKDGGVIIDREGKLPGRGAYVCRDGGCINLAAKRRVLERAFSCAVDKAVYEELAELGED